MFRCSRVSCVVSWSLWWNMQGEKRFHCYGSMCRKSLVLDWAPRSSITNTCSLTDWSQQLEGQRSVGYSVRKHQTKIWARALEWGEKGQNVYAFQFSRLEINCIAEVIDQTSSKLEQLESWHYECLNEESCYIIWWVQSSCCYIPMWSGLTDCLHPRLTSLRLSLFHDLSKIAQKLRKFVIESHIT